MYEIYINEILFPVAPSKIDEKLKGNNKTINLINEGNVNILKSAKLKEFRFELLLPNTFYPFAKYVDYTVLEKTNEVKSQKDNFKDANFYINILRNLLEEKKPFNLKIIRRAVGNRDFGGTNLDVSLESFSIKEYSKNGLDVYVSLDFKEYKAFATRKAEVVEETEESITIEETTVREITNAPNEITYTVKAGDTLWAIAKKNLGDGNKYHEIASLNGLANPNMLSIGQVLKIGGA